MSEKEYLSGEVERITFHNLENGFVVLKLKTRNKRDLVTLVGSSSAIFVGEFIQAQGRWIHNKEHGLQFKAEFLKSTAPNTLEGIEKYLGSGLIKGIGTHYAKKLVATFKDEVFEVIENFSFRLSEVTGIGKIRAERITSSWLEQKVVREIMIFLQSHGIGASRANRIHKTYGDDAIKIVSENPYRLAKDITGIGFVSADTIAYKLGIGKNSSIRAEAGISYTLLEAASEGHCGIPKEMLISEAIKLLEISREVIEHGLEKSLAAGEVISDSIDNEEVIFLAAYYRYEQTIANKIKNLLYYPTNSFRIDVENAAKDLEVKFKIKLALKQIEAIKQAIRSKILVITGGPGTGKTTLVKSIITILKAEGIIIKLAAPTGRAAKRLSETSGMEAQTIHRLLDFKPGGDGFKYNDENPINVDLLIIDEASMIDVQLMSYLLKAIPPKASLIIVGDIDQLPSVGPGNVLSDIIASELVPVVKLDEIFRQANDSLIITNAHRINKGLFPIFPSAKKNSESNKNKENNYNKDSKRLDDFYFINISIKETKTNVGEEILAKVKSLIRDRIPRRFNFNAMEDIQVLCPMQRGSCGAQVLNIALQNLLNPPDESSIEKYGWHYSKGDKVMQIENNYDKEVYNGDIGLIKEINKIDQEVIIEFDKRDVKYDFTDLDQISLAYAITIHKSQGSEYPVVIIPVGMQHYMMLKRNLIYTAVTRGKKLVIIIGESRALALSLKAKMSVKRYSKLKEFLLRLKSQIEPALP
jgi:exodeoxyribonuclease V alpha subunit